MGEDKSISVKGCMEAEKTLSREKCQGNIYFFGCSDLPLFQFSVRILIVYIVISTWMSPYHWELNLLKYLFFKIVLDNIPF